jgi:hypothetical protein
MSDGAEFIEIMDGVARALLGAPNQHLSKKHELRFGSNGSLSINLVKGTYYDFESEQGGGVIDLLHRVKGISKDESVEWLRDNGFLQRERPAYTNGHAPEPPPERERLPREEPGQKQPKEGPRKVIEAVYDYRDEKGKLLFQTVRFNFQNADGSFVLKAGGKRDKTFAQRRPNGTQWVWKLDGVRLVPYRLGELLEDIAADKRIYICEGEKKADLLRSLGLPATTFAMGAGKWDSSYAECFKGADVAILPDNDAQSQRKDGTLLYHPDGRPRFAGQDHADDIAAGLKDFADCVRVTMLPGLPVKGDVIDWHAAGGTVEQLTAVVENTPEWQGRRFVSMFGGIRFEDLDEPGPEMNDIIDGWFTEGDVSVIAGESKSGKSFLAVHKCMCIATARDFFAHKIVAPGLCIYQAGEGSTGIKKRFRAWRDYFGLRRDQPTPVYIMQSRIDIYRKAEQGEKSDTDKFIDECRMVQQLYKQPLRVVFIDTLAQAQGSADENSGKDMAIVMANVRRISTELHCHVCLVHHMNAGGSKIRGHTSIYASADQVILVTKDESSKIRTALLDKQKDGEDGLKVDFELFPREVGTRKLDGQPVTSCIVVSPSQAKLSSVETGGRPIIRLTDEQIIGFRALSVALDECGEAPMAALKLPMSIAKVVKYDWWLNAYRQQQAGKPQGTTARALTRVCDKLMVLGLIGASHEFVWLTGKTIAGVTHAPRVEYADRGAAATAQRLDAALDDEDGLGFK